MFLFERLSNIKALQIPVMVSTKHLLAAATALTAIVVAMCVHLPTKFRPPMQSAVELDIHYSAQVSGSGPPIIMADIPRKTDYRRKKGKPPGSSDLRKTYKLPRAEISESVIGVTQPIDDHWCKDFHLAPVPVDCTCWRYEYMAYFCVDWSCTNGHSSDFAMCQFLNVSWPIDPPKRRPTSPQGIVDGIKTLLKKADRLLHSLKLGDR